MLLIGEYNHSIDLKGRLIMPSRFRDVLGETFIVTKGLDYCLFVYSMDEWKILEDKIKALPLAKARDMQRFFFASATIVEADKQGRIVIPAKLRTYASLERDVVVTGASTRAEIWDKAKWEAQVENITEESIINAMNDLGF